MRLRWQRRALADLFQIQAYIAQHNPDAADTVAREIQNAAIRLKQFLRLGHVSDIIGIFELQVPGRPYVLPYRIADDIIQILAVFDQRRDPKDKG